MHIFKKVSVWSASLSPHTEKYKTNFSDKDWAHKVIKLRRFLFIFFSPFFCCVLLSRERINTKVLNTIRRRSKTWRDKRINFEEGTWDANNEQGDKHLRPRNDNFFTSVFGASSHCGFVSSKHFSQCSV